MSIMLLAISIGYVSVAMIISILSAEAASASSSCVA